MNLKKKITAVLISVFTALSFASFSVYAEDDGTESSSSESEIITSGDYKYSLKTYDDGEEAAVLEEYTGSDTEIVIPDTIDEYKVRAIGTTTFYENKNITEVTISKYIEEIGYFPFYGCTSLMEFKVDEQNETFTADGEGVLMGKDGLSITSYPTGKNPEKYTVADGIYAIHSAAFSMCTNLKEVTLPESLEYIGVFTFSGCSSLESVDLPDNITELDDFTFADCSSLTEVNLPENLQVIGSAVFFNCKALRSIDFPEPLYEIGQAAFCSTGITSITLPYTITSIGYSAFGFHTDENDQIVADENFVLSGYNGSYAQTYCEENEVTFVALDESTENTSEESVSSEKKSIPTVLTAVICVVCAAAIITAAFVIVKKTGKSSDDGHDDDENDDESAEEE
ncbi:MAG: leucine-rich repeat domain-containing protein [Clostridium sp.]|nr:leucine-rich repeat domain-containing protein [Clostridium sp.]MCM1546765.1 leucine-rich repeat domain-containing protein [Ruminococcus sp.]